MIIFCLMYFYAMNDYYDLQKSALNSYIPRSWQHMRAKKQRGRVKHLCIAYIQLNPFLIYQSFIDLP